VCLLRGQALYVCYVACVQPSARCAVPCLSAAWHCRMQQPHQVCWSNTNDMLCHLPCLSVLTLLQLLFLLLFNMQLTHDGRWLTTTDNRNTVRIWNTEKLDAPAKVFTVAYPAEAASYCPSKNRYVDWMWYHPCAVQHAPCLLIGSGIAHVYNSMHLACFSTTLWAGNACATLHVHWSNAVVIMLLGCCLMMVNGTYAKWNKELRVVCSHSKPAYVKGGCVCETVRTPHALTRLLPSAQQLIP
jgi:hypothetical protein